MPAWLEEPTGVLRVLRSEGIQTCRRLVLSSAPEGGSRPAILLRVAREVGADGSDPGEIAEAVGRDLAGPSASRGPVDAGAEGCRLGLQQGLEAARP